MDGCFLDKFPTLNLEPKQGTKYYFDKLMQNAKIVECICDGDGDGSGSGTIQLPGGKEMNKPSHDFGENEELSESEAKLVEAQTKHIVNQVAEQVQKMKGSLPGNIKEILDRINKLDPPKFDWKGYIRRFTGKAIKTYTKKSRRKYNKRLPDNPGLKIKRQKHILAAVDTSGSVSN
jgi:predicted metal-dependent peptidase